MIGDLATRLTGQTVGIEAHVLTVASHEALRDGGVETISRTGIVERLRAIKEPQELGAMREAAAISDRVFAALAAEQFTGRTEVELAWRVRELFHEHGASELAFDTIVAAAENGASPHADVRAVAIPANTLVTVDAGCRVDGYASDCTRTFATGELPDELARAYEVCLQAELAGLDAYGPGVSGRDADAAARDVIAAAGWASSSATAWATASGSRCTRRRPPEPSRPTRSSRGTSSAANRGSTFPGSAASGSRTWCS